MAHHRIVIETSPGAAGGYRAEVAEGPAWAKSAGVGSAPSRGSAYGELALRLRKMRRATFEFIHHEA